MARPQILLVNPPIYDFTAFDFWLRPYGMLRVAGRIGHACDLSGFDFLVSDARDRGRGRFPDQIVNKPEHFRDIPRRYRRFGRARPEFQEFLTRQRFDAVLIQTGMTYWYPGIGEVIEDIRQLQPGAKIVLGGVYATVCRDHAMSLGADLVVQGSDLEPLWNTLAVEPADAPPYWDGFLRGAGVIKLTEGCPFRCTYCSVPIFGPGFKVRPTDECLEELQELVRRGARNVAFYDDALLFRPLEAVIPFLKAASNARVDVSFHTPNALNARFVTGNLASLMVKSAVRTFFLGLENAAADFQTATGGKVQAEEFLHAVERLKKAGAEFIAAYVIAGHPDSDTQQVEETMRFAHRAGSRIMLAEFAPIPGTPDGERCREWADLDEPLSHNKTAFAIRRFGADTVNRLKAISRQLNEE